MESAAAVGLSLAALVLGAVGFLAYRQWRERQDRSDDLSAADSEHFARQDRRRLIGGLVMALIAVGLLVGSRINVLGAPRPIRRLFGGVWIAVILLIFVLLLLAWLDVKATHLYARRHRQQLADERREILERHKAELRRAREQDRAGPPGDSPDGFRSY